jgi:hypothetical protein
MPGKLMEASRKAVYFGLLIQMPVQAEYFGA